MQEGFEREVVADAPRQVERKVAELIDWLVDADFRRWQGVTEHLAERRRRYSERIVGDSAATAFLNDRARLVDSVGREAQRVVETYDKSREAQALADGARNAVAASAAVGAGALGLGTIVAVVATTAAADATGLVMASVLAAVGFFILPNRRRQAKQEMRAKVTAMRETLVRALRTEFEREMERGGQRIAEGIGPYSRFVRSEHATPDRDADDARDGRSRHGVAARTHRGSGGGSSRDLRNRGRSEGPQRGPVTLTSARRRSFPSVLPSTR